MISSNNELYSTIRSLIKELQRIGEAQWSNVFLESLTISTLPGEILGEIRLNLRKLKTSNVELRTKTQKQVDEALQYLDSVLGR